MPNQNILINAIMINETKTSLSIENIVTTHDEIYKAMVRTNDASIAAKEVADYRAVIWEGYNLVKEKQMINTNIIVKIQEKEEILKYMIHYRHQIRKIIFFLYVSYKFPIYNSN